MPKFSVKKPFTVLVGVILALVLGIVSVMFMSTDLLPTINLPYLMVITTYPGASPEKVESDITAPLEAALGTINGVENVTSTSSENFSMIVLEFAEHTNMDSAMVKATTKLGQLADALPERASTPSIMELSADMMATQYLAVDYEGMDIYQLSAYVENEIIPAMERIDGVARVDAIGLVEKRVEVTLDQEKIDAVNDKLLLQVNERLKEAIDQLSIAQAELYRGQAQIKSGKRELKKQQAAIADQLNEALDTVRDKIPELEDQIEDLEGQLSKASHWLDGLADRLWELADSLGTGAPDTISALHAISGEYAPDWYAANADRMPSSIEEALSSSHKMDALIEGLKAAQKEAAARECDVDPDDIKQIIETLLDAKFYQDLLNNAGSSLNTISGKLQELNSYRGQLEDSLDALKNNPNDTDIGQAAAQLLLSGMQAQLAVGEIGVTSGQAQLDAAMAEFEAARDQALESANLDQLLNMETLAQLIGAQNFSMPAGYIQDKDEHKFLLKVGDNYESVDELSGALLCSLDGIGDVRLSDVATITVTDNAADSYAKVDGNQAVLLSIYKGSTASTSDVSDGCNARSKSLMEADEKLNLTPIMDQGEYIRIIISNVMSNLIYGALLAVVVLVFFLKDVRPTLVVAISIPLSVLVALVCMYFTGISLNIISLSGLALGIGMLVDNSIVVIENIYRLRNRGIPAARAAVQGTKQVAGSIISSTITTICVFLPMLFSTGLVRQVMTDLALTITFSLLASLVVAMTVVPCAGSTVLKRTNEKKHPWFDKFLEKYEKFLRYCLRRKALPLLLAIALMVGCVWQITKMGMVLLPNISSNQMSLTVSLPDGTPREEAYATADAVMDAALAVNGIESIGAMSSDSAGALMSGGMSMGGGSSDSVSGFSFFIVLNEEGGRDQEAVQAALLDGTKDLNCTVTVSGSSMADMSALMGSGVEVDIYGDNLDTLLSLSDQVTALLADIPGIEEVSNGQEAGDTVIMIKVDKDEAMRLGLTVAQIYMELAQSLTTDTTSTTLTAGSESYVVNIIDTTKLPLLEDILNHEFKTQTMDQNGMSVKEVHTLGEFAKRTEAPGVASINRENLSRLIKVTSSTAEGYNTALLAREVQEQLDTITVPDGYTVAIAGETTQVTDMVTQMALMMALALLLIYLVMVAQFQSLLSPFIVLFTIPLAFTGGFLAMILSGEIISIVTLMGFLILMGVVVNNGIVFVDYVNQLRLGGLSRTEALVATGKTRMRPILMTTMTTILSMVTMLFSSDPGSEMGRGMALVIVGGLLYATLMTLVIVPVMYDIFFRKKPVNIDVGDDLDDIPDDAAELLAQMQAEEAK